MNRRLGTILLFTIAVGAPAGCLILIGGNHTYLDSGETGGSAGAHPGSGGASTGGSTSSSASGSGPTCGPGTFGDLSTSFSNNTLDLTLWSTFGEVYTANGGVQVGQNSGFRSVGTYSLHDCVASIQVSNIPLPGTAASFQVQLSGDSGHALGFVQSDDSLSMEANLSSADTVVLATATYDATADAFWRIRESQADAMIYWETSPDGVTWTGRAQYSTVGLFSTAALVAQMSTAGTNDTIHVTFADFDYP